MLNGDDEEIQVKINERKSAVLEVNVSHEFSKWTAQRFLGH